VKSSNRGGRQFVIGAAGLGVASAAAVTGAFAQQVAANDQASNDKGVETVVVTGRKAAIDLMPEKILNTPQSINVVPAEVIQQQGVNNLQDALKNVPGITLNAGEGGTHGDLVNLRGFPAGDDYFMDGLRDTGIYDRDTFDIANIEVYKGPASTLFGRGSTGGVINQVTKAPELFPIQDLTVTGGTNGEIRATADVNYVTGDISALRIALMGQRNNVEGRPFVRGQRWGAAPSFAWGLGTDTTVTLKYFHQQEDNIPDYGIPFVLDRPAPVPRDTFYGLPQDDRFKTDVEVVTGRVDHKINGVFSVSNTSRFGSYWFDSRQTGAIYGTANCFDANSPNQYRFAGEPECTGAADDEPVELNDPLFPLLGTPLDKVYVLRDRPSSKGVVTTLMNETDLTAKFATGGLSHTLVTGIEVDSEAASLKRFENVDDVMRPQPLLDPDPYDISPFTQDSQLHQDVIRQTPITQTRTFGLFAADTIDFGPQWTLTAAVRYDHFSAHFDQVLGTPSHFHHVDNIVSPRAALVYKPTETSSLYFSYGTSFNPSAENLSLAAGNKDLGPERDRTFEFGGKTEVLDGLLSLTAALFNTEMTNARITDPLDPHLQALAGTEKVNGFELNAQGRITENWEVIAGYTYLDATAVGLAGPGVHGPIPNTAHNQANLWTAYDFDSGLMVGAGLNYVGRVAAGVDTETVPGTFRIAHAPDHVTLDGMVAYRVNDNLNIRLNGYNLTDEFYYVNSYFVRADENHMVPGAGRTFLLSLEGSL